MAIEFILLILLAYLLGSVPATYLAARWSRGIDIRKYGSGNVGGANLRQLTSKRIAIPVSIFDLVKGIVAVWVAQLLGLDIALQVAVGLAAITGHNWPVFLRFSGGRGIATALGVAIILPALNNLVPWGLIVFVVIAVIGVFIFHNVPVGVGAGIAALPLVSWLVNEPLPLTLGFLAIFLIVIVRRLTVPRTPLSASVPKRQLLINRLLLDRDIRDKDVWINQSRPGDSQPENKEKAKITT